MDESIAKRMQTATNQLRQALGNYAATFVPVPVLFAQPSSESKVVAGTANAVNALLGQNGIIYYAHSGCLTFNNYITNKLPNAVSVDEWEILHCWKGEIHCGTAAQRELNLQMPWWQCLIQWE